MTTSHNVTTANKVTTANNGQNKKRVSWRLGARTKRLFNSVVVMSSERKQLLPGNQSKEDEELATATAPPKWKSVRGRRPTGYPLRDQYPVGTPTLEVPQGSPLPLDSGSEESDGDVKKNPFRRLSSIFSPRKRSKDEVQELDMGDPLSNTVSEVAGISLAELDIVHAHRPSILDPVQEGVATSSAATTYQADLPTPTRAIPTPSASLEQVPMMNQLPVNRSQTFGVTRAMNDDPKKAKGKGLRRKSSIPNFSLGPLDRQRQESLSIPLPSPSSTVEEMPDLMRCFSEIMDGFIPQCTTPGPSTRTPQPLPISTQSQERKTSLEPVSPKTHSAAPTASHASCALRQTSLDAAQDARHNSETDSSRSRHDSRFSDSIQKTVQESSTQRQRSQGGSSSSTRLPLLSSRSYASTIAIPPAVPESSTAAQARPSVIHSQSDSHGVIFEHERKTIANTDAADTMLRSKSKGKRKVDPVLTATHHCQLDDLQRILDDPAKYEFHRSGQMSLDDQKATIKDNDYQLATTVSIKSHASRISLKARKVVGEEGDYQLPTHASGSRQMSLEALKAKVDEHDSQLAMAIEDKMHQAKIRKHRRMSQHRLKQPHNSADSIMLNEDEKKKAEHDARYETYRQRMKEIRGWAERHPEEWRAREEFRKSEMKLSRRAASMEHFDSQLARDSPIPFKTPTKPGTVWTRTRWRTIKLSEVIHGWLKRTGSAASETDQDGNGADQYYQEHGVNRPHKKTRVDKGKGRAVSEASITPQRRSSFVEHFPPSEQQGDIASLPGSHGRSMSSRTTSISRSLSRKYRTSSIRAV
ncbi:Hypothetical protein D9617_16g014200 [Elsinoe fawcettii]|nr:Hypothetical protein D9617_16g014200 [Elsinoe fawcettii]